MFRKLKKRKSLQRQACPPQECIPDPRGTCKVDSMVWFDLAECVLGGGEVGRQAETNIAEKVLRK